MQKIKADILVIAGILLAAVLLWLLPAGMNHGKAARVVILKNGEIFGSYLLSDEQTISVPYGESGYNLVLISEGAAAVTDANCPDKLCVKQRSISRNGESIICLPHQMVVLIQSREESNFDAVTY